jgi:hypothetical protein
MSCRIQNRTHKGGKQKVEQIRCIARLEQHEGNMDDKK